MHWFRTLHGSWQASNSSERITTQGFLARWKVEGSVFTLTVAGVPTWQWSYSFVCLFWNLLSDKPGLLSYYYLTKEIYPKSSLETDSLLKCPVREENILDHCYAEVSSAYRAVPWAAPGHYDHLTVHLIPTCRQRLQPCKPVPRTSKMWFSEALGDLQACLPSPTNQLLLPHHSSGVERSTAAHNIGPLLPYYRHNVLHH